MQSAASVRQRILQVILELQGNGPHYVSDDSIAQKTNLSVDVVRGHLDILESNNRTNLARSSDGYGAFLKPGQKQMVRETVVQNNSSPPASVDPRKVFVVHGRNFAAREAMFAFLRAVHLDPLEWSQIVAATGNASPYIGEVLDKGFSIVQAVVVLMTPDDEARLREPYREPDDPLDEMTLTPQPRPNVLLEAGMALGSHQKRTIIVQFGKLRQVTDLLGRHVIRLTDTAGARHELAQRLKTAGCAVDATGTDWLKSGDFAGALLHSESSVNTGAATVMVAGKHTDAGVPELDDLDDQILVILSKQEDRVSTETIIAQTGKSKSLIELHLNRLEQHRMIVRFHRMQGGLFGTVTQPAESHNIIAQPGREFLFKKNLL